MLANDSAEIRSLEARELLVRPERWQIQRGRAAGQQAFPMSPRNQPSSAAEQPLLRGGADASEADALGSWVSRSPLLLSDPRAERNGQRGGMTRTGEEALMAFSAANAPAAAPHEGLKAHEGSPIPAVMRSGGVPGIGYM